MKSRIQKDIFVGRTQELRILRGLLKEAKAGRGQIVAVSGEPGIGKTRLAKASAEQAAASGFRVVWGRFHEGQYVPPYGPWKEILRGIVRGELSRRVRERLRSPVAPLVDLIPEIRDRFPGLPKLQKEKPDHARLRIMEAFLGALREASAPEPLFLILDNIHLADLPSRDLLLALAQEMAGWKLLVAVLYREAAPGSGPLSETIGVIAGLDLFTRVRLIGLDAEAVTDYLRVFSGEIPPQPLVRAVLDRTEGNPLFVAEVMKQLGQNGMQPEAVRAPDNATEALVPERLRLAILGRMEQLSPGCQAMLAAGALIGREFEAGVLGRLLPEDADRLDSLLDEALSQSWIEEVTGQPDHYRFTHSLIHEVVQSRLSPRKRAGLCLRIGEALEQRFGADSDRHAGELARYFDGAGEPGAAKAVRYYGRAGEDALRMMSYADSQVQFSRALAICEGKVPDAQAAELLSGLSRAKHGNGEFADSVAILDRAFDVFIRSGKTEEAFSALEQPYLLSWRSTGAYQLLQKAISLAGADSPRACRLGFHYGLALYCETGDAEGAERVFARTVEYAQSTADRALESWALTNWSYVPLHEGEYARALEMTRRAVALTEAQHEYWAEATGRWQLIFAFMGNFQLGEAENEVGRLMRMAERMRSPFWATQSWDMMRLVRRQLGEIRAARDTAEKQGASWSGLQYLDRLTATLIGLESGAAGAGLDAMLEAVCSGSGSPASTSWDAFNSMFIPYVFWTTGKAVPLDGVEGLARKARQSGTLGKAERLDVTAGLGLLSVIRGDQAAADALYRDLLPHHGEIIEPALGLAADHLLGLLARTTGDIEKALAHFQDAEDRCRGAGLRLELAYTLRDHAETLLCPGPSLDTQRAATLNREAAEIAERGGAAALAAGLGAQASRIGQGGATAPGRSDSLTPREVEVLGLLAGGLSNEEIGDHLFISPRTVAHHVQSILDKTGSSNRTEAAVYAVRNNLAGLSQGPA